MSDLEMLQAGIYRKIGRQRKRTLRKRGERVWFSPELQHYVWEPDWHKGFKRVTSLGGEI